MFKAKYTVIHLHSRKKHKRGRSSWPTRRNVTHSTNKPKTWYVLCL